MVTVLPYKGGLAELELTPEEGAMVNELFTLGKGDKVLFPGAHANKEFTRFRQILQPLSPAVPLPIPYNAPFPHREDSGYPTSLHEDDFLEIGSTRRLSIRTTLPLGLNPDFPESNQEAQFSLSYQPQTGKAYADFWIP